MYMRTTTRLKFIIGSFWFAKSIRNVYSSLQKQNETELFDKFNLKVMTDNWNQLNDG